MPAGYVVDGRGERHAEHDSVHADESGRDGAVLASMIAPASRCDLDRLGSGPFSAAQTPPNRAESSRIQAAPGPPRILDKA
jgi:hypothetical protein